MDAQTYDGGTFHSTGVLSDTMRQVIAHGQGVSIYRSNSRDGLSPTNLSQGPAELMLATAVILEASNRAFRLTPQSAGDLGGAGS